MKEFSCEKGHQFNRLNSIKIQLKEVGNYSLVYRYICPFCWPNGFLEKEPPKESGDLPQGE